MRRERSQGGEKCRGRGFRFYEPDSNTNVDSCRQLPSHRADRDSERFPAALARILQIAVPLYVHRAFQGADLCR
jgi:hypothetical protein